MVKENSMSNYRPTGAVLFCLGKFICPLQTVLKIAEKFEFN